MVIRENFFKKVVFEQRPEWASGDRFTGVRNWEGEDLEVGLSLVMENQPGESVAGAEHLQGSEWAPVGQTSPLGFI